MSVRYARCPRCASEILSLIETHAEVGSTDFGRHQVEGGKIIPSSDFWFEAGDPIQVELECHCGHRWTTRRMVAEGPSSPR